MAEKDKTPKFLIGLGASAGGLDALEQFFDNAPHDSEAAFIVVMHLSRDFKSMLDELLARRTGMNVKPALDGEQMVADTVYVIQPRTLIEVEGSRLNVQTRPDVDVEGVATAIDTLFSSIAKHWKSRGAAIVLSGSGSDGAKGLRAVRDAGGFTGAQSPETAKFDPMPNAAIATASVNAVESPDHLAETVIEGLLLPIVSRSTPVASEHDKAMARIVDAVIGSSSMRAQEYKHSTFERRVSRRMMELRIDDLAKYADVINNDPVEAHRLSQELLIGVTNFFRDAEPYAVMQEQVIPHTIKVAHEENRPIRIWIAGCATGEEVYSMAMLYREALRDMPFEIDVQIFATDISKKHLEEASRGSYSPERVSSIPDELLGRYFEKDEESGNCTVIKRLRKMVVFAPHDLLSDPPFTKLDLVCCRNVLIYFSVEAQQRILGGFAFGLRQGGFMFLGSSETVGGQRDAFEFVDARNRIFSRTKSLGAPRSIDKARELFPRTSTPSSSMRRGGKLRETELQPAYNALLSEFAPASLLISSDRTLLHVFGDAGRYLKAPTGVANLDVTEMIDSALKTPLIAAIERTHKKDSPLKFTMVKIDEQPEEGLIVDLTVRRLPSPDDSQPAHLLAIIDDRGYREGEQPEETAQIDADELVAGRIGELETELGRTREALQSTIEEIETANEELQASNEELMSANEELQSTNEELSSVNEELYSVNAEYHRQNDDLSRLTNDFDLLLNATQIGVLFLDENNRITRFTGLTKQLFNLEESDINRPLDNFNSPFVNFDPAAMLAWAREENSVAEIRTDHKDGDPWLIRLVTDDDNFGVVLAFIEIRDLREAEAQLRRTYGMLEAIRTATNSYFFEADPKMEIIFSEVGFFDYIGMPDLTLPHRLSYENVHPDDLPRLRDELADLEDRSGGEIIYRMFNKPFGDYRYVRVVAARLPSGNWQVVANDVHEIYHAEKQRREQAAVLGATVEAGHSYKAYIDADGNLGFANSAYLGLIDRRLKDVVGKPIKNILPPALYAQAKPNIEAALAGEDRESVSEITVGSEKLLLSTRYLSVKDGDAVIGFVFDGINISEIGEYAEKFSTNDRLITSITRNSAEAIILVDTETGRIRFANSTAQKMLGLAGSEFAEEKFNITRLTPECGEKRWGEILSQARMLGEMILNDMVIFVDHEDSTIADLYLETDLAEEERPVTMVRVIENPEKAKTLEDLRDRARQLSNSNRELEQFTTAVAHDLRAPLRHISSFSEILEGSASELSSDEVSNHASIIANSARSLSGLVAALLDYSRIGLREAPMTDCGVHELLDSAKQNLSEEIAESEAVITVDGSATIEGNSELLINLFQNLLGNAIKYAREGEAPRIAIDIKHEAECATITVEDNGIGIDPDFGDKIFQLFRRLHSDDAYSGLGIGLATCRKIAELHKGDIRLDTEYTGGSKFVVGPFAKKGD